MIPYKNPYEGRTREEIQAIEQAKRNHKDFLERLGGMSEGAYSPIGETWESMEARLCTPEQIIKADEWVKKIGKKIEAREARERRALAKQERAHSPQAEARV